MSINGRYIEDIIPGYRTLTVQGRELLASDVTTAEMASRDGSNSQKQTISVKVDNYYLSASLWPIAGHLELHTIS